MVINLEMRAVNKSHNPNKFGYSLTISDSNQKMVVSTIMVYEKIASLVLLANTDQLTII